MGEPSEPSSDLPDAAMLFNSDPRSRHTSSEAPHPEETPMETDDDSRYATSRRGGRQLLCVQLPHLSSSEKAKYRSVADDELQADEEFDHEGVDCVVGDVREGRNFYFYVRYVSGIVHKIPAGPFKLAFPTVVEDYETALAHDTLPPFDPTSSTVFPPSRKPVLTLRISRRKASSSPGGSTDTSSADPLAGEFASDDSDVPRRRRSRRSGANLPFSPRRTRGGRSYVLDSDSDGEIQEVMISTRRSTRARKARRENLDDEEYEDFSDRDSRTAEKPRQKKVARGHGSRAAYGYIRDVEDLQYDDDLFAHRDICEKCHEPPRHKCKRKKGRKRKATEDASEDEESRLARLGGWVRCLKCSIAAHWGCLASSQREEILRAARERDRMEWRNADSGSSEPPKRVDLDANQTTDFICGSCMKGAICMGCKEVALKPDQFTAGVRSTAVQDDLDVGLSSAAGPSRAATVAIEDPENNPSTQDLLFRCFDCKRVAHYAHLPVPHGYDPEDISPAELASYYTTKWLCGDCLSYEALTVQHILAWRPYPPGVVEPPRGPNELPDYKSMLPREYLVKWVYRSYRRVQWVPHGWLLAKSAGKLRHFLQDGTKVPLLPEPVSEQQLVDGDTEAPTFDIGREESEGAQAREPAEVTSRLIADPEAERRIPPAWRTVDRVLDIRLWRPAKVSKKGKAVDRTQDSNAVDDRYTHLRDQAYDAGEEPPEESIVTVEEYQSLVGRKLTERDAGSVAWGFFKWNDLGYDDATWDSPPRTNESQYGAYENAFKRFLFAQSVTVPSRGKNEQLVRGGTKWFSKQKFSVDSQPQLGQDPQLRLMPFQIDGVNWLCHNWNIKQHCILADEMGLGKTVQIVTFIGYIIATFKAFPVLVVVPNSTITNWVREFERWAPKLRVVPFYGESPSRKVIRTYELSHSNPTAGTTGAKYHVLVTTYDMITNSKDFGAVFKSIPRWEMLVVDEGQRLKSDSSLLFKRLKELNTFHRIIMTGTPLNNNIRELFNLMSFLEPNEWTDLEALSKQYEELTEELVKDLHVRLKPYFLRRIKSEVLQLPPKNEVIVPVSMAPLQKEIYRSILSMNLEILRRLAEGNAVTTRGNSSIPKTNTNNILMTLRKCLQHPYLVNRDIEPTGLSPAETHERLIGASAKLRLLKIMLPKLRDRGHRVLLFSQFQIVLDIIEDFLVGEGTRYLRLDGSTKQSDRQKDMDEFNKPNSEIFIYLLTTRAGGVGINLWSADTVIIFDPDFNPHQDLQAISRSHRYGQQKTVLVFKLMVKDSAEERIMQTGKKKLVLDHLIVQNMDDENGKEDIQSILMFGAKALFEETGDNDARQIQYSEHDIDSLIEKTEKEGDAVEAPESAAGSGGSLFAFAKVWSADKEGVEELADEPPEHADEGDSWAKALELIAARNAKEQEKEVTGRGVRRKAAAVFPQQQSLHLDDSPSQVKKSKKKKTKGKSAGSDDSDFHAPISESDPSTDEEMDVDIELLPVPDIASLRPEIPRPPEKPKKHRRSDLPDRPSIPIEQSELCGLCGKRHSPGHCSMTESPENLARYRLMLMENAEDEPIEERRAAIQVIDETLHRLGKLHLIYGQPLHPVVASSKSKISQPAKRLKLGHDPRTVHASSKPGQWPSANGTQPIAGPSRINGTPSSAVSSATAAWSHSAPAPMPRIPATANVAGSSTQHLTSLPVGSTNAPFKSARAACAVCGLTSYHLVKDCPAVRSGPTSIARAILRLSQDPAQALLVDTLRAIQASRRPALLADSNSNAGPSGSSRS